MGMKCLFSWLVHGGRTLARDAARSGARRHLGACFGANRFTAW